MTDYISRADAICEVLVNDGIDNIVDRINALPSADAVSREEYEETDGVVKIEKQNANEVGEIKHIVIHSPNYTRYFYNESMPTSADAVEVVRCKDCKRYNSDDPWCYMLWITPKGDWFCADGERKETEDEHDL